MVVRLSELLERIRPAGTPGAAGESAGRQATEEEIVPLVAVLRDFDEEADRVRDEAHRRADEALADAERRARRVRGELTDRVAIAGGESAKPVDSRGEDECRRVSAEARDTIERRRRRADAVRAEWVDRIVTAIWSAVDEPEAGR